MISKEKTIQLLNQLKKQLEDLNVENYDEIKIKDESIFQYFFYHFERNINDIDSFERESPECGIYLNILLHGGIIIQLEGWDGDGFIQRIQVILNSDFEESEFPQEIIDIEEEEISIDILNKLINYINSK